MTEFLRSGVLILFSICWNCMEKSASPPACPIIRELKSAVCIPQSRTATRGEEVWLGARVAAARITPHCIKIEFSAMNARESIKYRRLRDHNVSFNLIQNVKQSTIIKITRLNTLTALPLLSVKSWTSVLISSLAILLDSSLGIFWRKDFWVVV